MPDPVAGEEKLTRYIMKRIHRFKPGSAVSAQIWIQHPQSDTSVWRTSRWSREKIAEKGREIVSTINERLKQRALSAGKTPPNPGSFHGGATVAAQKILDEQLEIRPSPPPDHAGLWNWPEEDHDILDIAGRLAIASTLACEPDA